MAEPVQPRVNPKLVTPADSAFVTPPGDPISAELEEDRSWDAVENARAQAFTQHAPPSHLQMVESDLDVPQETEAPDVTESPDLTEY